MGSTCVNTVGTAGALVYLAKLGTYRRMPTATRTASSVKRSPHAEMGIADSQSHCMRAAEAARSLA